MAKIIISQNITIYNKNLKKKLLVTKMSENENNNMFKLNVI